MTDDKPMRRRQGANMTDNYVIDDGMSPFMDGTFTYHIRRAGKPGIVGTLRADHATHDLLQDVFAALKAAQDERDGYKAQVERVEALAVDFEERGGAYGILGPMLRAALEGPTPEDAPIGGLLGEHGEDWDA
jgi:hypothetical protein